MKTKSKTEQQRRLALTVRHCVHEIFNKSKTEAEARLGLDALQKVVSKERKERILSEAFQGDLEALSHWKSIMAQKKQSQPSKQAVNHKAEAEYKSVEKETREQGKREATEQGDLLKLTQLCKDDDRIFTPHVAFDGKLSFTGKFRRMENRHV